MTERSIIFSSPMVKAILDGRKTQTRRTKGLETLNQCADLWVKDGIMFRSTVGANHHFPSCPYGVPGDRLFCRETGWQRPERTPRMMREGADTWERYYYDADGLDEADHEQFKEWGFKRRPAIHMPRWASRITLEITDVKVERLAELSDSDAIAEGIERDWFNDQGETPGRYLYFTTGLTRDGYGHAWAREAFRELWDSIQAKRAPWASNPWVWAVTFRMIEP